MVQNVTSKGLSNFGTIERIGQTDSGRGVYKVTSPDNNSVGKISVAASDIALFEKSYNDMLEAAPKMQEYIQNVTPEKMEKLQRRSKLITWGTSLGLALPVCLLKTKGFLKTTLHFLGIVVTAFMGAVLGSRIAQKTLSPPGAIELNKASQTMSQLDIQAYSD